MAAAPHLHTPTGGGSVHGRLNRYIEEYLERYAHPNIVLVIGRSKNLNVVVYEALVNHFDGTLMQDKPLEGYWLNIDPVWLEKNRAKGQMDDREELGLIESSMAYGVKSTPLGGGTFAVTLAALPDREFTLLMEGGVPRLKTIIGGRHAYVSRAFVEAEEHMLGPKMLWVDLYGNSICTGEVLHERVLP